MRRAKSVAWAVAGDAYVGLLWLAMLYGVILYGMERLNLIR